MLITYSAWSYLPVLESRSVARCIFMWSCKAIKIYAGFYVAGLLSLAHPIDDVNGWLVGGVKLRERSLGKAKNYAEAVIEAHDMIYYIGVTSLSMCGRSGGGTRLDCG